LLFNKFFSDCRYMPYFRRYSPTKLCDGAKMAIFASCISSEPRAAHFRPEYLIHRGAGTFQVASTRGDGYVQSRTCHSMMMMMILNSH